MDKKVEAAPRWDGLDKVLGAYLFKVTKERVLLLPGLREYSSYFVEPLAPIGLARGAPGRFPEAPHHISPLSLSEEPPVP